MIRPSDGTKTMRGDLLPEYGFTGGVRGKYYKALREGYTVKINRV
jgi:hypothetical protein